MQDIFNVRSNYSIPTLKTLLNYVGPGVQVDAI